MSVFLNTKYFDAAFETNDKILYTNQITHTYSFIGSGNNCNSFHISNIFGFQDYALIWISKYL